MRCESGTTRAGIARSLDPSRTALHLRTEADLVALDRRDCVGTEPLGPVVGLRPAEPSAEGLVEVGDGRHVDVSAQDPFDGPDHLAVVGDDAFASVSDLEVPLHGSGGFLPPDRVHHFIEETDKRTRWFARDTYQVVRARNNGKGG